FIFSLRARDERPQDTMLRCAFILKSASDLGRLGPPLWYPVRNTALCVIGQRHNTGLIGPQEGAPRQEIQRNDKCISNHLPTQSPDYTPARSNRAARGEQLFMAGHLRTRC